MIDYILEIGSLVCICLMLFVCLSVIVYAIFNFIQDHDDNHMRFP